MNTNELPARWFRFGEFTFDCGSRQFFSRGEPRHLSPKALIVERIARHPRRRAVLRSRKSGTTSASTYAGMLDFHQKLMEVRKDELLFTRRPEGS